jgi:hypothetical protein
MVDAKALLEGIRQDLQTVTEQLLHHPYVQALEEGKIGREKLRLFAGEQYSIIASDLKSVAYLLSRFGSAPSRDFFLGILQGERAAWDTLLTFADALGLSEAQLSEHEPLAGAHAYTCYMAWLALYASEAEIAAAYLVNFPAWGQNCGRLSGILKERFGLGEKEVAFFDLFATPPVTFEAGALSIIPARARSRHRTEPDPTGGPLTPSLRAHVLGYPPRGVLAVLARAAKVIK